nr:hypothetical protein [Tanacetum cinerariifolium]
MRIEESLNVTFNESFPKPKPSPLVKDDRINEPIVQDLNGSLSLQVNVSDEGYPKSLKEARGHPIEQVIVLLDNQVNSAKTVLDDKALEDSSSILDFDADLYFNDEEYNGNEVVIRETSREEVRTRIYNTRILPSLMRGIGEVKI